MFWKKFRAAFVLGIVTTSFVVAEDNATKKRFKELPSRMVTVTYKVPADMRENNFPATLDIPGWIVERDRVVTMWFPSDAILSVEGKMAKIISSDFERRLVLLQVQLGNRLEPIETTKLSGVDVLAIDSHNKGTIIAKMKPPIPAPPQYEGFLSFNGGALVGPGGGIFSRDGRLITIVVGWEERPRKDWVLVTEPGAFQSFIKKTSR